MVSDDAQAITAVAILRVDRGGAVSDLDRFLALGLPSLQKFAGDVIKELVVVVPHRDVRLTTRRLVSRSRMPVRVIDEREVVSHLGDDAPGWTKQQVIKLAAPSVVSTPWYITLDADVVAARPIDREFLLPGGRAIWQQEDAGAHLDWWRTSADVLRSPQHLQPGDPAFGVTPAILHTETVADLTRTLEREYPGQHWSTTLMGLSGWTEYTLYWTHALDTGAASEHHVANDQRPYSLGGSVWTPDQLATRLRSADLEGAFAADAPHAFFVFQSNLEVPLADTVRLLRPLILGSSTISVGEHLRWQAHRARARARHILGPRLRWVRDRVARLKGGT